MLRPESFECDSNLEGVIRPCRCAIHSSIPEQGSDEGDNSQVERLSNITPSIMCRDFHIVQEVFDLHYASPVVPQSRSHAVPLARIWVVPVCSLYFTACVEDVEANLAGSLPFSHVYLWWPVVDACEPKRRPGPACNRCEKGGAKGQCLTLPNGELLLCSDRP
jgi:hypothetical protein